MACTTETLIAAIRAAAQSISLHRDELTTLDRDIGDGDHGENLARGFTAVLAKLPTEVPETAASLLKLVGSTLVSTVGGASGPLFGTAFLRSAAAVRDSTELAAADIAAALAAAAEGVQSRGKADPGDKTMVDALHPAAEAAAAAAATGTPAEVLAAAAAAATAGAAATIPLQARRGRASYLGARSIGHADPGATSVSYLLQAFAEQAR